MGFLILTEIIFAIVYLLCKKAAFAAWDTERQMFRFVKQWYYWFEFILFMMASVLTPDHTIDEGIIAMCVVIFVKLIMDSMTFIDDWLCSFLRKDIDGDC